MEKDPFEIAVENGFRAYAEGAEAYRNQVSHFETPYFDTGRDQEKRAWANGWGDAQVNQTISGLKCT